MRVFILGNANSIHIQRWAKGLSKNGIDIFIFSLSDVDSKVFDMEKNIEFYSFGFSEDFTHKNEGGVSKIKYLKVLPILSRKIKEFNPDIVHAHYISGYGTLGSLCGFNPLIVSVWGSDIFDFPKKSWFHRKLIEYNLRKADKILSTSDIMAQETNLYINKDIAVTPFGIDLEQFKPTYTKEELFDKDDIVVGTVKTLEEKYGIEYLIKAFKIMSDKYKSLPLKLLIVGGGSLEKELKKLAQDLEIDNKTLFIGNVSFVEVPKYHNMLSVSVSVSVSNSESFGVAIIEASACAKPVVVSNVGGLPEVVEDGVSGFVVAPRSQEQTANAIERLILSKELRKVIGKNGRARVERLYNWQDNVSNMIEIYKGMIR